MSKKESNNEGEDTQSRFDEWYASQERVFHCGHYDERQIARSAFCEGGKFFYELIKEQKDLPSDVFDLVNENFWDLV